MNRVNKVEVEKRIKYGKEERKLPDYAQKLKWVLLENTVRVKEGRVIVITSKCIE
jgi:hypothetical protein